MFKREGDKLVCREFTPAGIYKAIKQLDNDTVIYCTVKVISEFESFVSGNMRIRRQVNIKNITLEKLVPEKKVPKKKTPEKVLTKPKIKKLEG